MNKGIIKTLCAVTAIMLITGTATGCNVQNDSNNTFSGDKTGGDYNNGDLTDKGTAGDYEYEIEITGWFGIFLENRGYYIETTDGPNAPCYIIICSGERSCGGYDIRIDEVGIKDGSLVITVEENSPGPDTTCADVINYPYCVLKLNKLPEELRIINQDGTEFKEYGAFDERVQNNLPYKDLRWLEKDYKIQDGWIALLRRNYDGLMYETYVYKDGTDYKCFNLYVSQDFSDSAKWYHRFISENTCSSKEDVLNAANDFGSGGVMILPDDQSKSYSVNDFIKKDI